MKFYGKAEEVATRIIKEFKDGTITKSLSNVFIDFSSESPSSKWSWNNRFICAIYGHTDARGYRQWKKVGRFVKTGQKAFNILMPLIAKEKDKNGNEKSFCYGFKTTPVFGYSQTDGESINTEVEEDFIQNLPLKEVAESWGLKITTFNGGGKVRYAGYYVLDTEIALGTENLSTWAHELVHAADDRNGKLRESDKVKNEVVAELGGAILLQTLGYTEEADLGGCWEYVKTYSGTKEATISTCMALINRICKAVDLILETAKELETETVRI